MKIKRKQKSINLGKTGKKHDQSRAHKGGGLLPWLQALQGHSLLALGGLGMVGG